ncbi:MAG: hypothetical protein P794_00910 [Epsilonproteobacteria bacterium (ex Lamellibrachia satsuma)]|nr:MAG: hypothetical protein P794_00910 [Epsilonproteobacteria bacterium (ex Lamellibrachia satsuma)]
MKKSSLFILLFSLLFFTACKEPSLGGKVKREYFTGGKLRSEFFMTDSTEQNGLLKKYGYDGKLTSTVSIKNGVKNGTETWFDPKGRVIMRIPYVNGEKQGIQKAYYPNGDIMISYTYKDNVLNGKATKYNQGGTINKQVIYRNGKLVN